MLSWIRSQYFSSPKIRIGVKVVWPTIAAALLLLHTLIKDRLPQSNWVSWLYWILVAGIAALVPLATNGAKSWDDAEKKRLESEVGELTAKAEGWKRTTSLYANLNSVINGLVLKKSAAYLEEARDSKAGSVNSRDNFTENVSRIIATAYELVRQIYGDVVQGRDFEIIFWLVNPQNADELLLFSLANSTGQPPREIPLRHSHRYLTKDGPSLASLVWRGQEMVIVPDSEEEAKKPNPAMVKFYPLEKETKCLVGYPVVDRQLEELQQPTFIGVITIKCNQAGVFSYGQERELREIIGAFSNRIVFEMRRQIHLQKIGGVKI